MYVIVVSYFNCTVLNILVICFVSFYKTLKPKELGKRWKTISSDEKVEWQADAALQTKNPDILSVYSTSRQYVGEYAGNMPAIVPNSLDSHYSQSNNRSTLNISRIYRSPYIREESYMFEYTDTVSGSGATRYREYTGFFICREYIG